LLKLKEMMNREKHQEKRKIDTRNKIKYREKQTNKSQRTK